LKGDTGVGGWVKADSESLNSINSTNPRNSMNTFEGLEGSYKP
jgi:hypothetical protein